MKCTGLNERFRTEDTKLAVNFPNAYNFNKGVVYTRFILYKFANDSFAADIMYYKSCMEGHLLQFKRNVETIVNFQEEEKNIDKEHLQVPFKDVLSFLDLETRGYALSDIQDMLNQRLQINNTSKRFFLSALLTVYLFYIFITLLTSFPLPSELQSCLIRSV